MCFGCPNCSNLCVQKKKNASNAEEEENSRRPVVARFPQRDFSKNISAEHQLVVISERTELGWVWGLKPGNNGFNFRISNLTKVQRKTFTKYD